MCHMEQDGIVIRAARPQDAKAICRVQNAAVRRLPEGCPPEVVSAWSGACTPDAVRQDILQGVAGFVALVRKELVGFAVLAGDLVRVVCVHPAHARSGLGSTLLARLEEEARRRGVRSLRLNASPKAKPFYQARGYQVVREASPQIPLDLDLPCLEMAKTIAS